MSKYQITLTFIFFLLVQVSHAQSWECYIKNKGLIVEVKPQESNGKPSHKFSVVSIFRSKTGASKEKFLICGIMKTAEINQYSDCDSIYTGDLIHIVVVGNFYSCDSGNTFTNINDFVSKIRKEYNSELFSYQVLVRGSGFIGCGNASQDIWERTHLYNNPRLILDFNTRKDTFYNYEFYSSDCGKTWVDNSIFSSLDEFSKVDTDAVFSSNADSFVNNNLHLPHIKSKITGKGVFKVYFHIEKDGSLTNVNVPYMEINGERKSLYDVFGENCSDITDEISRCLRYMPKWIPARKAGRPVVCYQHLIIPIRL